MHARHIVLYESTNSNFWLNYRAGSSNIILMVLNQA
jgi:hypothetical protein